jgi:hypothetical protein
MDSATKAKFVLALHKHSLQALATGGLLPNVTNALTVTNGYNASGPNMSDVVAQQNQLGQQLQNEAAGNGPNPAQQQYLQNSQQIAQQQAAGYAGNRALNPGLAARMSGNTAATVSQNAASTAGIQQAEQQIAAQQQLQGLTGQEQAGSIAAQQINAGVAQNNANAQNNSAQGLLSGASSALAGLFAKGGMVHHPLMMADGGTITVPSAPVYKMDNYGVASNAQALSDMDTSGASEAGSGAGKWLKGKLSPAPSTLGASQISPDILAGGADTAAELGPVAMLAAKGGNVKAKTQKQKAEVPGNSYKNDKIPALLSEGEEVLPRQVMEAKDPVKAAAEFVRAHMAKKGLKGVHGLKLSGKEK